MIFAKGYLQITCINQALQVIGLFFVVSILLAGSCPIQWYGYLLSGGL
jgi:hypothetical protein